MRFNLLLLALVSTFACLTEACGDHFSAPVPDLLSLSTPTKRSTCKHKTAIHNVRIFNGQTILPPSTVVIDGHVIGDNASGATRHVDGEGGVLLPGFIESHSHPNSMEDLENLTRYGVTTAFQLACFAPEHCPSFQGHEGLVDTYHASLPATAPGSMHGSLILNRTGNANLLVHGEDDAPRWMEEQIQKWVPDFVKLIAQTPGLSQGTLNALVESAHNHGRKVACHAADLQSHRQASLSLADQIHHLPLDHPVDESLAEEVRSHGQVLMPTLSVMKAFSELGLSPNMSYAAARESLRVYHAAGVPILASTDANSEIAAVVSFGESFHSELELMVEAGMTTPEALRSATVLPAMHWGLEDRGSIEKGKRADLVLIAGDPIKDIRATRNIRTVWVAGTEFSG